MTDVEMHRMLELRQPDSIFRLIPKHLISVRSGRRFGDLSMGCVDSWDVAFMVPLNLDDVAGVFFLPEVETASLGSSLMGESAGLNQLVRGSRTV